MPVAHRLKHNDVIEHLDAQSHAVTCAHREDGA